MSPRRPSSSLLSISTLCVALWTLSALSTLSRVDALPPLGRLIGRRYTALEFSESLECTGRFDRSLVARLNMVCQDCYQAYQEPELYGLCRQDCFTSKYFGGCLQALHITDPDVVEDMHSAARTLKG